MSNFIDYIQKCGDELSEFSSENIYYDGLKEIKELKSTIQQKDEWIKELEKEKKFQGHEALNKHKEVRLRDITIDEKDERIKVSEEREKKLRECLKSTMGCGYVWDEHISEKEHDEKCDVCKCLKELGE